MKEETKILLNKNDGLDVAVDKVIRAKAFSVTLVIPKDSALGHSQSYFNALKRESDTAGKALSIESSDERVLELAAKTKIPAVSIAKAGTRPSMDVVRRAPKVVPRVAQKEETVDEKKSEGASVPLHVVTIKEHRDEMHEVREVDALEARAPTFFKKMEERGSSEEITLHIATKRPKQKHSWKRRLLVWGGAAVLVTGMVWLAVFVLPKATITLALKRTTVSSTETIEVGKDTKEVNISGGVMHISGELFVEHGNLSMSFPANGKERVTTKAHGTLTVYNAYSAAPQILVKSTRFVSPDGKIFRLDAALTIPAAHQAGGKLTPSKIDAAVTADGAGEEYNIAPATHWTIPGFKGTPRAQGFYADSLQAMTGGATGERPVLSDTDRASARQKVSDALRASLGLRILAMADTFKSFSSSTSFVVTKTDEQMDTADATKFNLYMEGELRQIVFDESILKNALTAQARSDDTASDTAESVTLEYGDPTFDFEKGTATFSVKDTVVFAPVVNVDEIRKNLLGSTKSTAEMIILGIPRLDSAKIGFWPFWVNSVPTRASRVEFVIR